MKKLFAAFIVCLSVLFAVGIIEIVLISLAYIRTTDLKKVRYEELNGYTYPREYFKFTDLGFQPKPGLHKAKKYDSNGRVIYDITYNIGENGFRITPNEVHTGIKIRFFGCSFVIGEGLNVENTLPFLVSQKSNGDFFSENYASHGFGVHQALTILSSPSIPTFDRSPIINVLLTAPWHSDRMICQQGQSAPGNPVFGLDENKKIFHFGNCLNLYEYTGKNPYLNSLHFKPNFIDKSHIFKTIGPLLFNSGYKVEIYLAAIIKMKEILDKKNEKFIVGYVRSPEFFGFFDRWNDDRIMSYLTKHGVLVVDLSLNHITKKDREIHPEEQHPSAIANNLRSEIIINTIRGLKQ